MQLIRNFTIVDDMLDSSNVPEADATEWDGTGGLPAGTIRMVTVASTGGAAVATHQIYVLQTGGDSTVDPSTDDGTNWESTGYTNRWKMFDSVVQDQTVYAGGIDVSLTPGRYTNAIAFINVDAATIDVIMTSAQDGEVYNETINLVSNSGINDWYQYFFAPIERVHDYVLTGLPNYLDATIDIAINDDGIARCGEVVIGSAFTVGQSLDGATFGIKDYSVKTTDESGRTNISVGPFAKRGRIDVVIDTDRAGWISTILAEYRATPTVWVADESNAATVLYGFFQDYTVTLRSHPTSTITIDLQGLI